VALSKLFRSYLPRFTMLYIVTKKDRSLIPYKLVSQNMSIVMVTIRAAHAGSFNMENDIDTATCDCFTVNDSTLVQSTCNTVSTFVRDIDSIVHIPLRTCRFFALICTFKQITNNSIIGRILEATSIWETYKLPLQGCGVSRTWL
jgi:hypothetical protein